MSGGAAGMQKRVSKGPVCHPHVQDFFLPSLSSAEVKKLEKPTGQVTTLFPGMRLDTVLAGHVFSS